MISFAEFSVYTPRLRKHPFLLVYPGHLTKVLFRTVGNYEARSAQSGI